MKSVHVCWRRCGVGMWGGIEGMRTNNTGCVYGIIPLCHCRSPARGRRRRWHSHHPWTSRGTVAWLLTGGMNVLVLSLFAFLPPSPLFISSPSSFCLFCPVSFLNPLFFLLSPFSSSFPLLSSSTPLPPPLPSPLLSYLPSPYPHSLLLVLLTALTV